MSNQLRRIQAIGTSVWIDALDHDLLEQGQLKRFIEADGVSGVTSNPTIFRKTIEDSSRDGRRLEGLSRGADPRDVYLQLAFADTRAACDLLSPAFERTGGSDGYVSFEVPPDLAYDAEASVAAAVRCRERIDRPNVLIKVPGTEPGVRAVEELTAIGVSVNVTLLFAVSRYEEVAEAYLRGLERRVSGVRGVGGAGCRRRSSRLEARSVPATPLPAGSECGWRRERRSTRPSASRPPSPLPTSNPQRRAASRSGRGARQLAGYRYPDQRLKEVNQSHARRPRPSR